MKLVDDWRAVLKHAWSVRLLALIAVLQGLDVALPLIGGSLPLPDGWLPWVTLAIAILAAGSRLIPQKALSGGDDAGQ